MLEQAVTLWSLAFVLICLWLDIAAYWLLASGEIEEWRVRFREAVVRKYGKP